MSADFPTEGVDDLLAPGDAPEPIAIIGLAGRFPGAAHVGQFWQNVRHGLDTITRGEVADDQGPQFVAARGFLDGVELFDAGFFGYSPAEAAQLDPQHRVWLEVAWEALEDAGYAGVEHEQVVGVYAGSFASHYLWSNVLQGPLDLRRHLQMQKMTAFAELVANDPAFLPTRTAFKLNLKGPAVNVQTACSTSLVAVSMAVQGLLAFETDVALVGGVCIPLPAVPGYYFQEGGIFARDGVCRPYDREASGTVFSSGAAAVVLRRLSDAERDGDRIVALILGAAVNNDGAQKSSYTAPSVEGQAAVIAMAQAAAGVTADSIGYVEGHGTATPLGDPIEVEALRRVFEAAGAGRGTCALSSVKGNIGHLDAAAGVAGLIRAALSLRDRVLTPTAHFEQANPELRLDGSPFYVTTALRHWPSGSHPRRAAVSSFGIGGTNAHVVLEEYVPPERAQPSGDGGVGAVLVFGAADESALLELRRQAAAYLEHKLRTERVPPRLEDVEYTLRQRRAPLSQRCAVPVRDYQDAILALGSEDRCVRARGVAKAGALRVFVFPGQGTLRFGNVAGLVHSDVGFSDDLRAIVGVAEAVCGRRLLPWLLGEDDAVDVLSDNALLQPAVFAVEVALARWLGRLGIRPDLCLGHSLGEWVAAQACGILTIDEGLRAVHERGRLMQTLGPGAATSVGLGADEVLERLRDFPELALAAENGPAMCLVSGAPAAVEAFEASLSQAGLAFRRVPISLAVHSPELESLVGPLQRALSGIRFSSPSVPLLSTVTGELLTPEQAGDVSYWARQMRAPVRFRGALTTLAARGPLVALEVGFGSGLADLMVSQLPDRNTQVTVPLLPMKSGDLRSLPAVWGRLWCAGLKPAAARGDCGDFQPVELPGYPFQRARHWIEPTSELEPPSSDELPSRPAGELETEVSPHSSDDFEFRLLRVWSGVLGHPQLKPTDNFYMVGGHSLMALRLIELINEEFRVFLSVNDLFDNPTVVQFLQLLRSPSVKFEPESIGPPSSLLRVGEHRGLFRIQPKRSGRPPLFLIHGDMANQLLVPHLPKGQEVWGYHHQGSDGEEIRYTTVESLAQGAHAEWVKKHGTKPCVLAGHSFGALVAYQIAVLRSRQGLQTPRLILIDSRHPLSLGGRLDRVSARTLRDRLAFRGSLREELQACKEAKLYLARGEPVPVALRQRYILSTYELAACQYQPEDWHGEAELIRSTAWATNFPSDFWELSAKGSVRRIVLPGTHLSIVREQEDVQRLGDWLRKILDELAVGATDR